MKSPFIDEIDDKLIESMTKRLNEKHTAPIGLSQGRFAIKNWGLADIRTEDDLSGTSHHAVQSFFQLPEHKAVLVDNPQLPGPIEYLYALIVSRNSDNETEFVVTAEKQFSMPGVEEVLKESEFFSDVDLGEVSGGVVIGIHSNQGHENHGASPEYADREKFAEKALQLAKQRLGISTDT